MSRPSPKHSEDRYDPAFIARVRPLLDAFYKYYFRVSFQGVENIPTGPALIVGNHNGIMGSEIFMLLEGWLRNAPAHASPVLALTHQYALAHKHLKGWLPKLGAISAGRESAFEAFDKGYSVLVYPGGDREAFRSFADRAKVDFDGRKGYAELALDADVPILPVVDVGGHEQSIILKRADKLAMRLGFHEKYRLRGIPVTIRGLPFMPGLFLEATQNLAFTAMMGVNLWPLPAKMDFFVEAPIQLSDRERRELPREKQIALLDRLTVASLQRRLSSEYARPRLPILGPL